MSERWRCFVAVPIADRLRADLARAVEQWREREDLDGLRWTDPLGWHITLSFLGAVPSSSVPEIAEAMSAAARSHGPIVLTTATVGAFPRAARARVAWYGFADPDRRLAELADNLARALDVPLDGPLRPHVTLARARRAALDLSSWLATASAPYGDLVVDKVDLMRSHIGAGPARYEAIASAHLRAHARV